MFSTHDNISCYIAIKYLGLYNVNFQYCQLNSSPSRMSKILLTHFTNVNIIYDKLICTELSFIGLAGTPYYKTSPKGRVLTDLIESIPRDTEYLYVFDENDSTWYYKYNTGPAVDKLILYRL